MIKVSGLKIIRKPQENICKSANRNRPKALTSRAFATPHCRMALIGTTCELHPLSLQDETEKNPWQLIKKNY